MKCLSSSRFKIRQLGWRPSSQVARHQVTNIMVTITITLVIAITTMVLTITMVINTMVFMITGEYKEECGTCALIAEGSTMPFSDNTCPQVAQKHTHTHTHKHTLTQSNIKKYANTHLISIFAQKKCIFPVWSRHHPANRGGAESCLNKTYFLVCSGKGFQLWMRTPPS